MPPKTPQEDRPYDYAPYTPYDRERWVRVFYVRYSPAANRRHACLYYGSLAVMMVLLLLTLFVHDRGFTLPAAMCQFLSVLYLVYMILLTQHAEKHSWLLTYEHCDRDPIKNIPFTVGAERVMSIRLDSSDDLSGAEIPLLTQYALHVEAEAPIVCQFGRLDTTQNAMSYYVGIGYAE